MFLYTMLLCCLFSFQMYLNLASSIQSSIINNTIYIISVSVSPLTQQIIHLLAPVCIIYMYKEDLLWVWREWVASIIRTNRDPPPTPDPLSGHRQQISGCGGILMTTSHCNRCWNTVYMYAVDLLWVWMVWGASIITYSMTQVRNQVIILLLLAFSLADIRMV
jgi:hypothetical protein